jgi:hypothetical protein
VQAKLQQEINELQRQNNMAENEINELYRQNNMAEKTIASLKTDIKVRLFLRACFVLVVSVQAKLGGVKRKLECVVEELSPCLGGKKSTHCQRNTGGSCLSGSARCGMVWTIQQTRIGSSHRTVRGRPTKRVAPGACDTLDLGEYLVNRRKGLVLVSRQRKSFHLHPSKLSKLSFIHLAHLTTTHISALASLC